MPQQMRSIDRIRQHLTVKLNFEMWTIVHDKSVKSGDPSSSFRRFREIPPKPSHAVFRQFFGDNFRLEVVYDVISGVAAE